MEKKEFSTLVVPGEQEQISEQHARTNVSENNSQSSQTKAASSTDEKFLNSVPVCNFSSIHPYLQNR